MSYLPNLSASRYGALAFALIVTAFTGTQPAAGSNASTSLNDHNRRPLSIAAETVSVFLPLVGLKSGQLQSVAGKVANYSSVTGFVIELRHRRASDAQSVGEFAGAAMTFVDGSFGIRSIAEAPPGSVYFLYFYNKSRSMDGDRLCGEFFGTPIPATGHTGAFDAGTINLSDFPATFLSSPISLPHTFHLADDPLNTNPLNRYRFVMAKASNQSYISGSPRFESPEIAATPTAEFTLTALPAGFQANTDGYVWFKEVKRPSGTAYSFLPMSIKFN